MTEGVSAAAETRGLSNSGGSRAAASSPSSSRGGGRGNGGGRRGGGGRHHGGGRGRQSSSAAAASTTTAPPVSSASSTHSGGGGSGRGSGGGRSNRGGRSGGRGGGRHSYHSGGDGRGRGRGNHHDDGHSPADDNNNTKEKKKNNDYNDRDGNTTTTNATTNTTTANSAATGSISRTSINDNKHDSSDTTAATTTKDKATTDNTNQNATTTTSQEKNNNKNSNDNTDSSYNKKNRYENKNSNTNNNNKNSRKNDPVPVSNETATTNDTSSRNNNNQHSNTSKSDTYDKSHDNRSEDANHFRGGRGGRFSARARGGGGRDHHNSHRHHSHRNHNHDSNNRSGYNKHSNGAGGGDNNHHNEQHEQSNDSTTTNTTKVDNNNNSKSYEETQTPKDTSHSNSGPTGNSRKNDTKAASDGKHNDTSNTITKSKDSGNNSSGQKDSTVGKTPSASDSKGVARDHQQQHDNRKNETAATGGESEESYISQKSSSRGDGHRGGGRGRGGRNSSDNRAQSFSPRGGRGGPGRTSGGPRGNNNRSQFGAGGRAGRSQGRGGREGRGRAGRPPRGPSRNRYHSNDEGSDDAKEEYDHETDTATYEENSLCGMESHDDDKTEVINNTSKSKLNHTPTTTTTTPCTQFYGNNINQEDTNILLSLLYTNKSTETSTTISTETATTTSETTSCSPNPASGVVSESSSNTEIQQSTRLLTAQEALMNIPLMKTPAIDPVSQTTMMMNNGSLQTSPFTSTAPMVSIVESAAASSKLDESMTPPPTPVLNLPTPPPSNMTGNGESGAPLPVMILSRANAATIAAATSNANEKAAHASNNNTNTKTLPPSGKPKKDKKPKPRKKKPKAQKDTDDGANNNDNSDGVEVEEDAPEEVPSTPVVTSAVTALEQLSPIQVSITADTQVVMRRIDSAVSLASSGGQLAAAAAAANANAAVTAVSEANAKKKKSKSGTSSNANSNAAQIKAARRFNHEVRRCVDQSDPVTLSKLLRDKKNHKYALDALTLETCLKAYIVAAMLDDALYCLRHVAQPATLSTAQAERILGCLPQNLRNSSAFTAADMLNSICIATEFPSPTCRTYFLRIVRGIALEFLEEATSARDRICSAPCERLVRAGVCIVNCSFRRGKKPTDLVVVPGDQLGVFISENDNDNRGIQAGDAVSILPFAGPYPMSTESLDRNMIEATVTNTGPMVLRLQDKTNGNLLAMLTEQLEGNVYRIDKVANRMGYNRQLAAAVTMASTLPLSRENNGNSAPPVRDTRRPCPELIRAITAMDENINRFMLNGGVFPKAKTGRTLTSTAELCADAIPWSVDDESLDFDRDAHRASVRLALEKFGALEGLNASQSMAVEGACTNRLTLIQGPPGTGKTAVAIRILEHWARMATAAAAAGENPTPILATSDSNIAVDNLVDGCASVGLKVIRLGRPEAIRPELLRYCIDRPQSSYGGGDRQNNNSSGTANFKERMKQLKSAQVICCTCIGSGGDILDSLGPLDHVLVDEATQATEAAVLVPLMRGCRQLVLVGDHCQLPPTVLSTRAEEEGHGVPLFSRMVACGVPPFMLDTQYRMHPCIAMFPSDLFYGGLLRNGVSAPERRPLAGFPWPREEFPVAFIPIKGIEMDDGVSKFNEDEAAAAVNAVTMLVQGGQCTVSDIAVVTPYAAQARLIRRMIRRLTPNSGPPFVEVSSVDGFQGREKEAVVFSAVRSNDYGAIGFTSDWRRINVSFTRARRALIVIGNDQTLRRGDPDTWMPWLAWADAHGLNMDKPGVPRGRYEPEQLRRVRGGTTAAEMLKDVLRRQQAQLKSAELQQERAERNARGNIISKDEGDGSNSEGQQDDSRALTLQEDLAMMEKEHANWDDSDDENEKGKMKNSVSKTTLSSGASSNDLQSGSDGDNGGVDIWDL